MEDAYKMLALGWCLPHQMLLSLAAKASLGVLDLYTKSYSDLHVHVVGAIDSLVNGFGEEMKW